MDKSSRRRLCLPEMLQKFEQFTIPDDSYIRCYIRKYKAYDKENIPFYEFTPTQEELDNDARICEEKRLEKEARQAEMKRLREERRRTNPSRRNRANDDVEAPEEVPEVQEEIAQVYLDDLIEEINGEDAELDALLGGFLQNQDFQNEVQANPHLEQNRLSNPLNDEIVLEKVQDPQPKRRTKRKRRLAPKLREQFE